MANDLWRTPKPIYEKLDAEFDFAADMASSDENTLHSVYFTEETNSLENSWFDLITDAYGACSKSDFVWCNPPYSEPMPWIKMAIEAQKDGLGTVMLLNADTSVAWFAECVPYVSEIRFIISDYDDEKGKYTSGRISFCDENNNPVSGNSKPQFILIFDPFKIGDCHTRYVTKRSLYE